MKQTMFGDVCAAKTHAINIIVHGCNAQGVMGSGVALAVKTKWPGAYSVYRDHVFKVGPGHPDLLGQVVPYFDDQNSVIIANAITQLSFGKDGRRYVDYQAVQTAFNTVVEIASNHSKNVGVHYPLIGAGLGGGDWSIISDIIEGCFSTNPELQHFLWLQR